MDNGTPKRKVAGRGRPRRKKPLPEPVTFANAVIRFKRDEVAREIEIAYITDELQRPLEYWWEVKASDVVGLRAIEARSAKDKWGSRRKSYWDAIKREVLEKSRIKVVDRQVKELAELESVRTTALDLLKPKMIDGEKVFEVEPKSFEGVARVLVQLDDRIDTKRESVLKLIDPDLQATEEKSPVPKFTPEEMQEVAKVIIQKRIEAQNKKLLAEKTDKDTDDQEYDDEHNETSEYN